MVKKKFEEELKKRLPRNDLNKHYMSMGENKKERKKKKFEKDKDKA